MSKKFKQFFLKHFKSINTTLSPVYISKEVKLIRNTNKAFTKDPP
ncbi:hypothetical protein [Companilactobacillus zhongbaensis]|nr:hypothetical protein [Companilactobacillus zhongbaensis]